MNAIVKNDHQGFTLVELAIALMVIGLLIGGVLKGQELIENARVTAFVKQYNDFDTAILIFRNTYGAFPGDIKRPNRIPNCTSGICNIPGNGNGRVDWSDTSTNGIEIYNFFPHMSKAGMLKGTEGGTEEEFDASISASDPINDSSNTHYLFFPEMPIGVLEIPDPNTPRLYSTTKEMARIDTKMDDGLPDKGRARTEDCSTVNTDGTREYNIAANDEICATWIGLDSLKPFWQ